MHHYFLEVIVGSFLLLPSTPSPKGESALAAGPASPPVAAGTRSLAIEVVEAGAGPERRIAFVVPVDGELDASVDGVAGTRHCQASVRPLEGALQVELKCSGRKSGDDLRVRARRSFGAGERVQVAAVEAGGRTTSVFVQARP